MAQVTLRPDLKTSSGEIHDIMVGGRYAGTMALVFREGHRVAGSIQLDREALDAREREEAIEFLQGYIEQLVAAVQANDCEVIVTCSPYEHIIAADAELGDAKEFIRAEQDDQVRAAFDAEEEDVIQLRDPSFYELVLVGESRNRLEYHVYDQDDEWIAEAFVHIRGSDVSGELNWNYEPLEDEIEPVVELLVADFDEEAIDTIQLDLMYRGVIFETIELTHEDLDEDELMGGAELDDLDEDEEAFYEAGDSDEEDAFDSDDYYPAGAGDYSIILARDDGDAKMYDIYHKLEGGFPVGSATIDLGENGVSGYIEFREAEFSEDREEIGALLLQELDKEGEFDNVHLTMLVDNRPIDEIVYSTEAYH